MYQADEKRYETMHYNRCGNSGLLLPELSLGPVSYTHLRAHET